MSGDERREEPRYGEYATPEEVLAALGPPRPPAPGQRPHPEESPPVPSAASSAAPVSQGKPAAPPRPWDRMLTIVLLGLGLFYLLGSFPSLLSFDVYLERSYREFLGVELDFGTPTRVVGQAMLVANSLIFGVSAVAAWRRLRSRRLAFWVALVGAAVTFAVIVLGAFVVMIAEPGAFAASAGLDG